MALFPNNFESFGLDIGDLALKAVYIKKVGGRPIIAGFNKIDISLDILQRGEIKDMDKMAKIVKDLLSNVKPRRIPTPYVHACLPEVQGFIKLITVKNGNDDEIRENLLKELPNHIPLDIEDSYIDWRIISHNNETQEIAVLVGAVPKPIADNYNALLIKSGLKPMSLQIEAEAIMRCLLPYKKMPRESMAIVDVGATRSSFICLAGGAIQFSVSLPFSGEKLTRQIERTLQLEKIESEKGKILCGLDASKCQGILAEILKRELGDLVNSIRQSIDYNSEHFYKNPPIKSILLCGGGANLKGATEYLNSQLPDIKFSLGNPFTNIAAKQNSIIKTKPAQLSNPLTYTTSIGLALSNIV